MAAQRDSGFEEDIEFLLPHGMMVNMKCDRRMSLRDITESLWAKVIELPAANRLRSSSHYVFVGVTRDAEEKEMDPRVPITDLPLIKPILEISEPLETRDWERHFTETGNLMDVSIPSLDQISSHNEEHRDVRIVMKHVGQSVAREMTKWSMEERLLFQYRPRLDLNTEIPLSTVKIINKGGERSLLQAVVYCRVNGETTFKTIKHIFANEQPREVTRLAMQAHNLIPNTLSSSLNRRQSVSTMYLLKRLEKEEYFLEECGMLAYEYVRDCFTKDEKLLLEIVSKNDVIKQLPDFRCLTLDYADRLRKPSTRDVDAKLSWNVSTDKYYSVVFRDVPVPRSDWNEYYLEAQIYHGKQALCHAVRVEEYNRPVQFSVSIESLPRNARLCFTVIKKDKVIKNLRGTKWVNMQIFDHKGALITGEVRCQMFAFSGKVNRVNNPLGLSGLTKNVSSSDQLWFEIQKPCPEPVRFPSSEEIDRHIEREERFTDNTSRHMPFDIFDRICAKEVFNELTSTEKSTLWETRAQALEYQPKLLPRIIQCVDWTKRHVVFQLYQLIRRHRVQNLEVALQLLGPEYPDRRVRRLAVEYLASNMPPQGLNLYLLQFVQALLFESYHDNDLAKFLLKRALLYRDIGHKFFWLLRSEMHNPVSQLRFAPLLESYCLYCGAAVFEERRQEVETAKALHKLAMRLKDLKKESTSADAMVNVQTNLRCTGISASRVSVMDRTVRLGELKYDRCKPLMSKMRPVWLSWENKNMNVPPYEAEPKTIDYIVKIGDDMRQDMLALQLLKVMDTIWKYSFDDYHLVVYNCMALGENFGLIEAVLNAKTVNDIHMTDRGKLFRTESIHAWLYRTTPDGDNFQNPLRRFKYSAAACVVGIYLLGIGDRHPSNILVKNTGEMFHIDFGHFMGHRKSKVGIRRERTPFVITKDFMNVVRGGKDDVEAENEFMYTCFQLFMSIRRHGTLFLTLLNLMMHSNLPELNCQADIEYCRDVLGLDKPDHEVAKKFFKELIASYKKQWMTNLNFWCHRLNKAIDMRISTSS
ncbi:phosphatidylinositol 4,5-bisphosphate 3-kinase catalytic subunit alpha isoform-like [Dreissena polymorpha]|uniref:Phosphatidylinositol 3-kinase n=1 Tax=Dreissena polymorpha TaxID=45954 RepID=A0A9D4EJP8_DREPO|nr:phosphatidylinositol 4,5-bisphosphate 3-kinase catalytic subunit alpha isoform-like [Dreissena polymorpha]XP_052225470.1 phosphatidylinositol 4,5-bisphosphate 3-kinase catalytic subunit alpha isoform-like [Dreissena polymorpha]XP_052225471.1 phosphatidylinositol 4,5-bisphosphate 3-kinase catalytic subunit alpha isoform-like [Dreissena polymorpha]XP_052225472.1 phosphatidylinositol 4,5-bisphosphate 3-kinase catalytic subunit alpha isoform-like [Dreissena polymorpha]XP_052225473.1 phosphatidyl